MKKIYCKAVLHPLAPVTNAILNNINSWLGISQSLNSTTFKLRKFSADLKFIELFYLPMVEFKLHICVISKFTNYNWNQFCLHCSLMSTL